MVPPLRRKPSMKTSSFIEKRKAVLKVEDPEHFTIAQLKATLRAANVSEHDISLCIERSQLNTLYKERLDTEFKACVVVQRHWRRVLDSRRAKKAHDRMERHGLMDEAAHTGPGGKQKKESDVFARLSNREVEFYRDVFEQIDVDGSGEIDDKELKAALEQLGQHATDESVEEMVAEVGKDGVVDFEGFLKLVTSDRMDLSKNAKAMLSKAKVKKFQKAFHEFDEDNSGEIDAWELKKVLESLGQKPTDEDVEKMICEVVTDDKKAICFDDFLTIMTHPDRALAQVFADRMDALSAEVGANVTILKMWRFMAAELNPALGRPRLADPKMVLRIRAGCVPIRTVLVRKTFIEKRVSEETDSNETLAITHTVECKEVQVLLVSSNTFPSFWVLPSGGQRLPRAQDGEIDWSVQSPEEAALEATAEEAGAYGDIVSFLGPIEDHWKFTLTRWFHLGNVVFEDDYKRPLDIWTEKNLRTRKWVPLVSEEVSATNL